jgi:uncharacterized protein YbdZ (MbtH family)
LKKVHFDTNPTEESAQYAELANLLLVLLNRVSVELTVESQLNKILNEDQFRVSGSLVHSACAVGTLLPELIEEKSIRLPYAFPIARMCYERLLSAAYVLSDNGEAAKRSILYSVYSAFKNQKRHYSAGNYREVIPAGYRISRKSNIVAEAIDYFEKQKNAKLECELDRHARCKIIGTKSSKAGMLFESVEQAGHATSSEIVHGSYHSTLLFSDSAAAGSLARNLDEATTMIMMIFVLSSEAIGHLLAEIFPALPSPPLLIEAGKTFAKFELPEHTDLVNRAYGEN